MTLSLPLPLRPLIHAHYLNMRALWRSPDMPRRGVQKGFEELLYGVLGEDAWRTTHVSEGAIRGIVEGWDRRGTLVNRAHGILPGSVDRHVRTAALLEGPELPLDAWWAQFVEGDTTVLITRGEHSGSLPLSPLVPLPPGGFKNAGFGVGLSLKREGVWLSGEYERITGLPSPIAGRLPRAK